MWGSLELLIVHTSLSLGKTLFREFLKCVFWTGFGLQTTVVIRGQEIKSR